MNYENKKIALTGYTGFLGKALDKALTNAGARVVHLAGDVRNAQTFSQVDYSYDMLFHFGAPSSQILFKSSADYCVDVTINGMRNAIEACQRSGVKLIFPSTGLLSHGQSNEYARCKEVSEDLARGADINWLAVRVFGTYGPGESQKQDFASVPYLFMQEIMQGRQPIVYGTGEQSRDFIYVDDTVQGIIHVAELLSQQIVDIGSGDPCTFNEIITLLNKHLGTDVKPEYVDAPQNYIKKTGGNIDLLKKYYAPKINLDEGLRLLVQYARKGGQS